MSGTSMKVTGLKEARALLNSVVVGVEFNLSTFANSTKDVLKENIYSVRRGKKSSKSNLAESFKVQIYADNLSGVFTAGVGLISNLPDYWFKANVGGYVPTGSRGSFGNGSAPDPSLRGTGVGAEKWNSNSMGDYFIKPKSLAMPLNYLERTVNWIEPRFISSIATAFKKQ